VKSEIRASDLGLRASEAPGKGAKQQLPCAKAQKHFQTLGGSAEEATEKSRLATAKPSSAAQAALILRDLWHE